MDGKRALLIAVTALGLTALTAAPSTAQTYPNRPVKIVVPFAPGGPTEFIIRLIADRLTAMMGQAFVIENRPGGAGGTVGAKSIAVAEADGYTLLFSSPGPLVTAAAVYRNLDYDPIKSFAPIAMVIYAPQMLAVHPTVPASSVQELVAHAKDNPGKITFGSSGFGTQPHMLGAAVNEILKSNDAQDGLARLSAEARIGTLGDFAAFIAAEAPRWATIAAETGIKVD